MPPLLPLSVPAKARLWCLLVFAVLCCVEPAGRTENRERKELMHVPARARGTCCYIILIIVSCVSIVCMFCLATNLYILLFSCRGVEGRGK